MVVYSEFSTDTWSYSLSPDCLRRLLRNKIGLPETNKFLIQPRPHFIFAILSCFPSSQDLLIPSPNSIHDDMSLIT